MSYRHDRRDRTVALLTSVRERIGEGLEAHETNDGTRMYASRRAVLGPFFKRLLTEVEKQISGWIGLLARSTALFSM